MEEQICGRVELSRSHAGYIPDVTSERSFPLEVNRAYHIVMADLSFE